MKQQFFNTNFMVKAFACALILATTSLAHAQTCNPNIQPTRPDSRYQDMGAEVKDMVTGLIWQRCSIGQTWNGNTCTGTATGHTWQQALIVAKNLGNGYRLPNIKELKSIVEWQCYEPAINSKTFPNTPNSSYWSSSPLVNHSNYAWGVNFIFGYDDQNHNPSSYYVRAVRSE